MERIIDRILKLVEAKGIKANDMAKDLNLSSGAVSIWKSGKSVPGVDALQKISEYFNVSLDYLIVGTERITKDSFSSEEISLIFKFRALSDKSKAKVEGYIDGLASAEKENQLSAKLSG